MFPQAHVRALRQSRARTCRLKLIALLLPSQLLDQVVHGVLHAGLGGVGHRGAAGVVDEQRVGQRGRLGTRFASATGSLRRGLLWENVEWRSADRRSGQNGRQGALEECSFLLGGGHGSRSPG